MQNRLRIRTEAAAAVANAAEEDDDVLFPGSSCLPSQEEDPGEIKHMPYNCSGNVCN